MQPLALIERAPGCMRERVKKWGAEHLVPVNRAFGIRIVDIAPDSSRVVLRLLARRRNQNHDGSVHGGVILAFAETAHGIAVLWQFSPARFSMVTKSAKLTFLNPGRGELMVQFGLDRETRERLLRDLTNDGRSEIELASRVVDGDGNEVADLLAMYVIRARHGPYGSQNPA